MTPSTNYFQMLQDGNFQTFAKTVNGHLNDEQYEVVCDDVIRYMKWPGASNATACAALHELVKDGRFSHLMLYHHLRDNIYILMVALEAKDDLLFGQFEDQFMKIAVNDIPRLAQPIYFELLKSIQPKQHWHLVLPIYDLLVSMIERMETVYPDITFYCNCLWPLQHDNTGLPINHERNERYLALSLPLGKSNAAIYFNAACLYTEMKKYELAFDCIKRAIESGLEGEELKTLIKDLSSAHAFQPLRANTSVMKYLATIS